MSYQQHLSSSAQVSIRCAIVTLSDTRSASDDVSGDKIVELLKVAGMLGVDRLLLREEPSIVQGALARLIERDDIDAILTTGGTGISRRDLTIPIIEKMIEQPLPGFGELFRQLSYQQIGSGAMLSRAIAGVARGKVIFAMPGSTGAVELAMTKLILPEIRHLVGELRK